MYDPDCDEFLRINDPDGFIDDDYDHDIDNSPNYFTQLVESYVDYFSCADFWQEDWQEWEGY
jgi:hypothetical protein